MEAFHGVTLPFGAAKGAAIALLMDLLSGLFTGAAFGGRVRSLYNDTDGVQATSRKPLRLGGVP